MNPNHHITKYLNYYLDLKNNPEFAILLRGKWGSGKSWYINDFINNSDYNFIYVSLNGITSYKEIEDSFLQQLHPILASKGMKIAGKLLKGLIKTTIKIDLDNDNQSDGSITSSIPNDIELPSYFKNLQDRILIFDDLERCSIEIDNILGYITQFVEHQGLKVIIIAHEDEIIEKNELKNGKGLTQNKYLRIKEKLIGSSFDINSDFDNAIISFRESLNNDKVEKLINKNTPLIRDLFLVAGYDNLRHLKQSILDLERFYSFLPSKALKKADLLEHILQVFFVISFELRKGQINEENIPNLFLMDALARKDGEEKTPVQKIRDKYTILGRYYHPFDNSFWFQYFKYGFLDNKALEVSISNSIYFQEDNTPDWMKLWRVYNLNDDDFNKISERVFKSFEKKLIENKYEVVQVTGILLTLSHKKLISQTPIEIIELGKSNIDSLKSRGVLSLKKHEEFPSDSSHGLGYQNYHNPDFMEFWNYAKEEANKARIGDLPSEAINLLMKMKSSMKEFQELLVLSNSNNNLYYDIAILQHIPIDKFTRAFLKLSSVNKRIFGDVLEKRYSYSHFNKSLKDEMDWLIKLKAELDKQLPKIQGKISKLLIIENTLPEIEKSIEILKHVA